MVCKKCEAVIPDNALKCPACGTRTINMKISRGAKLLAFSAISADALSFLMGIINICVLISSAHYVTDLEGFFFLKNQQMYLMYPALPKIDILFGILVLLLPFLSAFSRRKMKYFERSGLILITAVHIATLLWGILYLVLCRYITGIVSPITTFCIWQAVVFAVLSASSLTHLWCSGMFV